VYEVDAALVTLARTAFDLRRVRGLRLRGQDGRDGLAGAPAQVADVVIRDAFTGNRVPARLATLEWLDTVRAAMRPGGVYLANVADGTQLASARREAATAQARFGHVALIAEPAQLRGRRFGNVVLLASDGPLPETPLVRRLASGAVRARYVGPERVAELTAGTKPLVDAEITGPGLGGTG
jgi:spermidine synthase